MSTVVEATPIARIAATSQPQADACVIVIFGATGDLAKRKLVPALYDLASTNLAKPFDILGVGRSQMSDQEFRANMKEAVSKSKDTLNFSDSVWTSFEKRLHYTLGDTSDPAMYPALAATLEKMRQAGSSANTLFYLSTPASIAPQIIGGLGKAGLSHGTNGQWSRVVVEKPFGRDLESARALNREILSEFDEHDVYRIDHYLGKETVQNILVFRFGNSMFEPIWNRNYIEYVEITAAETLGVESRAGFYEETGALRDMVANHMLQLLTLTAMEPPVAFEADAVREQKVQVLRSIKPMTVEEVAQRTVRGQYGPGSVNAQKVPGYRDEAGVAKKSTTETFAAVEFHIDNWRWAGVPFYIRTGKRLSRSVTEVAVHLKRTPQAIFSRTPAESIEPNVITLRIQPNEGISMTFAAKAPGTQMHTATVRMDFAYKSAFGADAPVAYETLLLDAIRGDATLFTRRDEVEFEWRLITPIEEAWAQLPAPPFPNYPAGSVGPTAVEALVHRKNHEWHDLNVDGEV